MDPETSTLPSSAALAGHFYDALAPDYDAMTGFERRFEQERPFFQTFVERYAIRCAVDAGAGTGFHALLLAQLGVRVTAVDVSSDMIQIARAHAESMHLPLTTLHASLHDFAGGVKVAQDAVVCMGNTLAHFTEPGSRDAVLAQFHRVLAPGGVVLVQTLNFDKIMTQETHLQNVKEAGGVRFVREYVRAGDLIDLHITRSALSTEAAHQTTTRVRLAPVYAADLSLALTNAGFTDVHLHGSIALDAFVADTSRDLVAVGRRT
jgi:2-polyprenyl-3-methyl-5-hydroxy-6-metoxy-1,4-benzoquinol methylase